MDRYGFCHLSCLPVRAEASDRSEMVNQLLFGETFEVVDAFGTWKVIRGSLDKYEGFIDQKQFLPISEETFTYLKQSQDRFPQNILSWVTDAKGQKTLLMPASSMAGFKNGLLNFGDHKFEYDEPLSDPSKGVSGHSILEAARLYLNAPYIWGGRSLTGIDCSGLVQNVYKMNGIKLHRDASYQAKQGEILNLISEALPGDLAFFDNDAGEIIHVGIVADEGKLIHASGHVRIDDVDHNGIYNQQIRKYTHKLRLIKRIL